MGVESNVVVCGDWREQSFGKPRRGFEDMVARFHDAPGAGYVHFDIEDCKRHDFVKTVIERYRDGRPISERPAQKCNS
jgi:phosphate starvation-inducible protein PhoH